MDEYKAQLNKIAFSEETYKKITSIGDRHYLLIDQVGELAAEIRDVVTGVTLTQNFIDDIKSRLEISQQTAEKIAEDVSKEIFDSIKESLRKVQEEKEQTAMSPVTQPPSFTPPPPSRPMSTITPSDKIRPSYSPLYNDSNLRKEDVLRDLENIERLRPENAENFVEHLLTPPVSNAIAPATPPAPEIKKVPVPPPIQRKDGADPYREPF